MGRSCWERYRHISEARHSSHQGMLQFPKRRNEKQRAEDARQCRTRICDDDEDGSRKLYKQHFARCTESQCIFEKFKQKVKFQKSWKAPVLLEDLQNQQEVSFVEDSLPTAEGDLGPVPVTKAAADVEAVVDKAKAEMEKALVRLCNVAKYAEQTTVGRYLQMRPARNSLGELQVDRGPRSSKRFWFYRYPVKVGQCSLTKH